LRFLVAHPIDRSDSVFDESNIKPRWRTIFNNHNSQSNEGARISQRTADFTWHAAAATDDPYMLSTVSRYRTCNEPF
jgi:hypothetical protein